MNKSTASRTRIDPPLYDDNEDGGDKDLAMPAMAESAKGKRLRNAIILGNLAVWLVVIALVKWFFF